MAKRSAGLLMYRRLAQDIEIFLVHPGGPFWVKKDFGSWTIPKGEYSIGEDTLEAAKREFEEETGIKPMGEFRELVEIKQSGGKVVKAWAFEGNCDPTIIKSNTFTMEWPPHSGREQIFPEIDRADWFALDEAKKRILSGQVLLLEELQSKLSKNKTSLKEHESQ